MDDNAYLKKKLRKNLLNQRRELTLTQVNKLSKKIYENFITKFNNKFFENTNIVACYLAFDNEPNIFPILKC